MIRARWVTDKRFPADVTMRRNRRMWARRRGGGYTLATSIYLADVMVVSSRWPVAKAIRLHIYGQAKARAEVAARILRGHRETGNSSIDVKRGAVDTSVFLRDPLGENAKGRQIGGAAFAVEGQTQALGTAFDTVFVRKLHGWKERFGE